MLHGRHVPYLIALQVAFIIIFGIFVDYDLEVHSAKAPSVNATKNEGNTLGHFYPSKLPT